jgi:peptide/nickel transport system permease protein
VALAATAIFLGFLLMALLGPLLAPYSATQQDIAQRLQAPSLAHYFGTDQFGRDVFSRVIVGSRDVFFIGGLGTLLAAILGVSIGLFSGYYGGLSDEVIMRVLDVFLAIPALLLALVLLATTGPSVLNLILVIVVLYVPTFARITRSMVLDLRTKEFVEAARVRGEKTTFVLFSEILPNTTPPLLVEGAIRFGFSIFLVASLGFLGLGVQPPSPDWGLQISEARDWFSSAPWMLLFPAGAIALLVISTNLMTDGMRQVLRPVGGGR